MNHNELPNFPGLFETIGEFLAVARASKSQKRKLQDARRAFDTIARVLYSRQAKAYPCGVRPRISPMPLEKGYPCTRIRNIPIMLSSRSEK
jgi:hypothetical protein